MSFVYRAPYGSPYYGNGLPIHSLAGYYAPVTQTRVFRPSWHPFFDQRATAYGRNIVVEKNGVAKYYDKNSYKILFTGDDGDAWGNTTFQSRSSEAAGNNHRSISPYLNYRLVDVV